MLILQQAMVCFVLIAYTLLSLQCVAKVSVRSDLSKKLLLCSAHTSANCVKADEARPMAIFLYCEHADVALDIEQHLAWPVPSQRTGEAVASDRPVEFASRSR